MTALIFNTCCGCIELRTGCLIIGYLNLVYSIIGVISMLVAGLAVGVVATSKDFREQNPDFDSATVSSISVLLIIMVVITLVLLIFNIVFLVGVHQNKRGHVKAYLVFNIVFLVLYLIMFLAGFASTPINWGGVVQNLCVLILSTYFMLVIRSYYYKMDDVNRQPAIYNTA